MKQLTYRILLKKEEEGGFTVTVPALAGCITYGETIDEAISMANEAIAIYIESLVAHGEPIPDETNTLEYNITLNAAI
jgi:antitoxin HicB